MSTTRRDVLRNALKRLMNSSKKAECYDEADIESFLKLLNYQWEQFSKAQGEVEDACGETALPTEEAQREQGDEWYRIAFSNFARAELKIKANSNNISTQKSSQHVDVKLPRMDLPHFSGVPSEWKQFYDAFSSLIHNEASLTGSQKLHYLRCSLQGNALNVIKSFKITDSNYKEAWELLSKRYNVERIIVDAHFRTLFSLPKLSSESSTGIRSLLDSIQENYRSLKSLGRPVTNWDDWLVHLTVSKLDQESHRQWELSQKDDKVATFTELVDFLETRCHSLDAVNSHNPVDAQHGSKSRMKSTTAFTCQKKNSGCYFCGGKHRIFGCEQFRALPASRRIIAAQEKSLCKNCLSNVHRENACRSTNTCRTCQAHHHTLLHQEEPPQPVASVSSANVVNTDQQILLGTALAKVRDSSGRFQPVRILFDNASHLTFIAKACVERLQLRIMPSTTTIEGICAVTAGRSRGTVQLALSSVDDSFAETIQANILPKLTNALPPSRIDKGSWQHIHGLSLADPNFNVPAAVDILLGCDQIGSFLLEGLVRGPKDSPIAQQSTLGWVLFGKVATTDTAYAFSTMVSSRSDAALTKAVTKFWHLEELPDSKFLTNEEHLCEEIFNHTHYRQSDGRYVVKLPFKSEVILGDSRDAAVRALHRMERIFAKDEPLHSQYAEFMQEFIDLGHMEEVCDTPAPGKHFYMPHRAVVNESSTTTKLRVVFNASAKTTSGFSLNDAQLVGPQLQPDLFSTLLRFRCHRFALIGDVEKMYRQVRVHQDHIDFQRIVWRRSPTDPVKDYRLLTVTYGVASASYLAVKALQQTAVDESHDFPAAAESVQRDFYMDDLLTGSYSEVELQQLQSGLATMLNRGGFHLRKWSSNSTVVLNSIPAEQRQVKTTFDLMDISDSESVKTLGLQWHPSTDAFAYSVQVYELSTNVLTKRILLADAAKLFDPLGLLAPTTVIPKMMFQRLWRTKINWDEEVPATVRQKWLDYRANLPSLAAIRIPRWIGCGRSNVTTDLHGFADASEAAYAAVVYARTMDSNGVVICLIAAKTRVAPIKQISLPRLELCAAALLAQLMVHAKKALGQRVRHVFGWTDSSVVLAWLHQHPSRWCTFVANRVSRVQDVIPSENWLHVPSAFNPADCASRGLAPEKLKDFTLWWNGPPWLSQPREAWPSQELFTTAVDQKSNTDISLVATAQTQQVWNIIDKYSSISKLKRVTAFIFRFINNIRCRIASRKTGKTISQYGSNYLSLRELNDALTFWIKDTQRSFFADDIHRLQSGNSLGRQSKLSKLHPFLDPSAILRVGGRLRNAPMHPDKKHPILLPARARLTEMICQDVHRMSLHAGPSTMLAILRGRFWVINARNLLRKTFRSCVKCRRYRNIVQQQLMSDLPRPRVEFCRPFLRSGVDFAGPVLLRLSKGRGTKAVKGYISIFICMSTGAMHLELASDLSSGTFIAVLKRFVSRRGRCADLYSDNGTNFVGAEKELRQFLAEATRNEQLAKYLRDDGMVWHFNPPAAPHMGGYWEAAVKRVKFHLRRTLDGCLLTFEEFSTLLAEIEACVNSRPLCPATTDVDDLQALTPGHFLVGEPLITIPEPDMIDLKMDLVHRWRLITQLRQHFWRRWHTEYLQQLQQRAKWTKSYPNFTVGDLVVLRDDNIPPSKWRMGRVTAVHTGADGRVRVVTLKTADGVLVRPIVKISPLLTFKDDVDVLDDSTNPPGSSRPAEC